MYGMVLVLGEQGQKKRENQEENERAKRMRWVATPGTQRMKYGFGLPTVPFCAGRASAREWAL